MSAYLHAEIHAVPGKLQPLLAMLKDELFPVMEAQGWKLIGCFTGLSGPRNTILDLWELRDMEHFREAYQGLVSHPNFQSLRERLDAYVESETLTFYDRFVPTAD